MNGRVSPWRFWQAPFPAPVRPSPAPVRPRTCGRRLGLALLAGLALLGTDAARGDAWAQGARTSGVSAYRLPEAQRSRLVRLQAQKRRAVRARRRAEVAIRRLEREIAAMRRGRRRALFEDRSRSAQQHHGSVEVTAAA